MAVHVGKRISVQGIALPRGAEGEEIRAIRIDEEKEDRAILTHFTDIVKHIDQLATCRCQYDTASHSTSNSAAPSRSGSNASAAERPELLETTVEAAARASHQSKDAVRAMPMGSDENATAIMRTICDNLFVTPTGSFFLK